MVYQVLEVDEVRVWPEEGFGRLFGLGAARRRRGQGAVDVGHVEGRAGAAAGGSRGPGRGPVRREQVEVVQVGGHGAARDRRPRVDHAGRRGGGARRRLGAPGIRSHHFEIQSISQRKPYT